MIKILHYISGLADSRAGVEVFIMTLFANVGDGISFSILTRNSKKNSPLHREIMDKGIQIYDLEIHTLKIGNSISFYKKLDTFFVEHKGEFDFIHMHGCDDPFVLQLAKKHGIKEAAVHVHSVQRENKNRLKTFIKNYTSKNNIRYADYRFACSCNAGKSIYKNVNFDVIPNCIETKKYQFNLMTRNVVRKEMNLSEDEIVVCYVGRFSKIKNLEFLVEVFACLRSFSEKYKLIMIGDGEEKNSIIELIEYRNLKESVSLIGQRSDVYKILNGMDIYLQTSYKEGFSLAALEAQCNGLQTFVSDGFPDEIMVTDNIQKIKLNEGALYWASRIDSYYRSSSMKRVEYCDIIAGAGYDTKELGKMLRGVYIK